MSDAARAAVDLADLLLKGNYAERVAEDRAAMPAALRDQVDAARDHAHAAFGENTVNPQPAMPSDFPEWVVLSVTTAWTGWIYGESRTCPHAPTPVMPQPVCAVAWMPNVITCLACTAMLSDITDEQARQCDGCGSSDSESLVGAKIVAGQLLFFLAVCETCRWDNPVLRKGTPA